MKTLDKLTYVSQAEGVIDKLDKDKYNKISLTSNQIRNVLSLVNELYDMARMNSEPVLNEKIRSHAQYVKMRLVYAAGRDNKVKDLLKKSDLLNYLDAVGNSKEELILVCRYTEALVAYHKFYSDER